MAIPIPSFQDLYDAGKAEALIRRPELSVINGDVSYFVLAAGAAMGNSVMYYAVQRFKATFLDTATGDDLTVLVSDRTGLQRLPATQAQGTVSFNRNTAAAGAGTIYAGSLVALDRDANGNQVQYTTDVDLSYGATETGFKSVTITAVQAGPSGNVLGNTINNTVTTLFDSSLSVYNPGPAAGGQDEESDNALRARARSWFLTLARGTKAALEFGAHVIASVTYAKCIVGSTGLVNVYVADASGGSNPTMVTAVATELLKWQSAGEVINVIGAVTVQITPITIALTLADGIDGNTLTIAIQNSIVARLNKLAIGDACTLGLIEAAVWNVDKSGNQIRGVTVTATIPAAGPAQLLRTTTAAISVTF